jgi:hypothetical protein
MLRSIRSRARETMAGPEEFGYTAVTNNLIGYGVTVQATVDHLARRTTATMVAMHGRLASDLAKEHMPELILQDLHVPDIFGERAYYSAPIAIHAARPERSLCATPTLPTADSNDFSRRAGPADLLTKPSDVMKILPVIDAPAGPK